MNRIEIEKKLNEGRDWLIEKYVGMSEEELNAGVTPSEHDPSLTWSAKDHLVHLILIETTFNTMIRRHIGGERGVVRVGGAKIGANASREEVMAAVHAWTEAWAVEHRDDSLDQIVALGQRVRGETLTLLSELTQEQLDDTIPGAPWANGVIGGIIGVNADHGRMHFHWAEEGRKAAVAAAQ